MRNILIFVVLFSFFSCNNNASKNVEFIKHKDLIGSKVLYLADMSEESYEAYEEIADKKELEIKYIDDIIYVSLLEELNACGEYGLNIETKNDTIKLKTIFLSDEMCCSASIRKLTYIINNPDKKEKVIIR